ncbi:AfsR/SARP family transcriptional regulator [Micromonospora cathayae]|uniref:BTAD domain-containing putative transcriptional regulator n=1 Tax=Micromonospora cathayae TaxID=3028804 RepID=A0ABY7ZNP5_9ACTN|nr:BTAD domain-containing putative transcriptional regulator [Micromonospora sp. HUAS 3]WDZ84652.1 BTAD domain-containing putative transcriptional regulator [Micromonospora sp. HUAS 3]
MFFGILGPVEARTADGTALPLGGRQLRALLALLLLDAGRMVGTDRLIDGLHGGRPPAGAANALQSQVSRLRRALRPVGVPVLADPAGYRLAVDPETVDVHRAARLRRDGGRASAAGRPDRAVDLLGAALALWRGDPLADVTDVPFAAAQVTRLVELRLSVVEEHAAAALAAGDPDAPIAGLRAVTAAHPLRERPHGLLMRALYATGRSAEALAVYADLRRALADELGAEPSAELAALHLAVLRGDPVAGTVPGRPYPPTARPVAPAPPSDPPPDAPAALPSGPASALPSDPASAPPSGPPLAPLSGSGVAGRLPAQVSSFVGRDAELARVAGLLDAGRLVTVTGPGGVGKTRLAVEVAGRRPDEVCFADLAPLPPGAGVAPALLDALGLRETTLTVFTGGFTAPDQATTGGPSTALDGTPGGRSGPFTAPDRTVQRLVGALAARPVLLVLDNCEHVVADAAPIVRRLLADCPGLRVLATGREPLGITGELLCPLPPLPVPAAQEPPETAVTAPAVRLFADRATAVRPDFTLDAGTVEPVRRICAALDGLPLAIELAAVRVRALPLDEIAARLDDRFRLLSRGDRTAAPRHRTLYAVVRWSWDLLDEAERRLLRRLTVFVGGATGAAADQVCAVPDVPDPGPDRPADTADLLAALVDRSLLEHTAGRYRMLETVRDFGAERLAEAGEEQRFRRAHAEYVLRLATTADPYLRRAEQVDLLHRLRAEHRNLHAALRWAVDADPRLALRLVGALTGYWYLRGLRGEVAPLAADLLRAVGPAPPDGLVEEYVLCAVHAVSGGQVDDHADHLARTTALVDSLDGPPRQPFLPVLWAQVAGPPRDGLGQRLTLIGPDPWSRALSHLGVGLLAMFRGDLGAAEVPLRQASAGFRSVGDRWGTSQALDGLATVAACRGRDRESLDLRDEALDLVRQLGADEEVVELRCRRAERLLRLGDADAARAEFDRAAELARRGGLSTALARVAWGLGEVARRTGDLAGARRHQTEALARTPAGWADLGTRITVLTGLGRTAQAEGDPVAARGYHRQAVEIALDQRNWLDLAEATEGLAGVMLYDGAAERAAWLLGLTARLRGGPVTADREVTAVVDGARAVLGAAGYAAAYAAGGRLGHEEARVRLRDLLEH